MQDKPENNRRRTIVNVSALYIVSLWPFLNFMDHNWGVMTGRILGYGHTVFAVCFLLAALLGGIFYKIGFARWCFVFCVLVPTVFLYGVLFSRLDPLLQAYAGYEYNGSERYNVNHAVDAVYGFLFLLAGLGAFRLSRVKDSHQLALVLALALAVLPASGIAGKLLHQGDNDNVQVAFATDKDFVKKPNVYLIAMDGYPRGDVIKDVFDYDNDVFLNQLEGYGFHVLKKAQANYPNTHLSMASTLQAAYLDRNSNPLFSAKWHAIVTGENASVRYFKDQGYAFALMESGIYALTKCVGLEDMCLSSPQFSLSEHEYALLRQTPWAFLKRLLPIKVYLTETGANLGKLRTHLSAKKPVQPFFLFAHTVPPHAPYAYNRDCSVKAQFDHGYAEALSGQGPAFFQGYLDNIICANKQGLEFAEYVTKNDPEAIVVLFSDHGSHFTMDWQSSTWNDRNIRERFSTLVAIRAPEACQQHLYDGMSNVNIMRFVFACLTDTAPDYLEDKSYYSSYVPDTPYYGEIITLEELKEGAASTVPDIVE